MPLQELQEAATQLRSFENHLDPLFFFCIFYFFISSTFIEALESVDFDPVSVFWENQQNSDDSVFNNSVTGAQSKKMQKAQPKSRTVLNCIMWPWQGRQHAKLCSFSS